MNDGAEAKRARGDRSRRCLEAVAARPPDDPWGRKWAAHLYRRAAFGGSPSGTRTRERRGPDDTLDLLLRGSSESEELTATLIGRRRVSLPTRDDDGEQLRGWWLYCMLQGGHPLREKLTLFWHNHFATSIAKVREADLMFRQNSLLREHALGKFGPLLLAMSHDAAMLVWLDSNSNVKGKPNENYARELMELFSPRCRPLHREGRPRGGPGLHRLAHRRRRLPLQCPLPRRRSQEGPGPDRQLERRRCGADLLEQPAAAHFLVRKLYARLRQRDSRRRSHFSSRCAESFRKSDYDIAALVKTMLSSRHCSSPITPSGSGSRAPSSIRVGPCGRFTSAYRNRPERVRPLPQQVLVAAPGGDGQAAVRAAERQGLAGRQGLAEHGDRCSSAPTSPDRGDGLALGESGASRSRAPGSRHSICGESVSTITVIGRSRVRRPKSRRRPGRLDPATDPGTKST